MTKFVVLSFAFMAFAFYELSGGDDFVPRKAELIAAAEAQRAAEAAERDNRVAARTAPLATVTQVTEVTLRTAPKVEPAPVTATVKPEPVKVVQAPKPAIAEIDPGQPTLISLEQSSDLFARPLVQLQEASAPTAPVTRQATTDIREVTGSRVNMRNGPGTGFGVLTSLPRGTAVEVIGTDGTGWVKLRTVDDQLVGWMAEYLLTEPTG